VIFRDIFLKPILVILTSQNFTKQKEICEISFVNSVATTLGPLFECRPCIALHCKSLSEYLHNMYLTGAAQPCALSIPRTEGREGCLLLVNRRTAHYIRLFPDEWRAQHIWAPIMRWCGKSVKCTVCTLPFSLTAYLLLQTDCTPLKIIAWYQEKRIEEWMHF